MSIDFHLYRVPDGVSFEEWHAEHLEADGEDVGIADQGLVEAADRVKARVLAIMPGAEVNEAEGVFGFQIFDDGDGYGLSFELDGAGGLVNVSSWDGPEESEGWVLVSQVLLAVVEETGLTAYDPQLDQVLTADMLRVESAPAKPKKKAPAVPRTADSRAESPKKRWWWPF